VIVKRSLPVLLRAGFLAGTLLMAVAPARSDGPISLYNGRDLSDWHVESGKLEAWQATKEGISCVKPGGGYLATDAEYGDFTLRLEYRLLTAGGNSGVGLRFPRGGWPSTDGMEIQLIDEDPTRHPDLKPVHANGSIYSFVPPKARAAKPVGEWTRLQIRCRGPRLRVRLNGVEVQDVDLSKQTAPGKGKLPLSQRPRRGLIGLQSHGDPVEFRQIEILNFH
jgi:hypothetical protein